jgi:hypothetical protein
MTSTSDATVLRVDRPDTRAKELIDQARQDNVVGRQEGQTLATLAVAEALLGLDQTLGIVDDRLREISGKLEAIEFTLPGPPRGP